MYLNANSQPRTDVGRVTVDGVDVTRVSFEVDDEKGWARCYLWRGYPNPPGESPVFVIADGAGHVDTVELRGVVEIVLKPEVVPA
jgi:hypothetical protein